MRNSSKDDSGSKVASSTESTYAKGKMTNGNATQEYIAKRLALSRATVSRCFTNHPGIRPETRAKVFALASQVGYLHPVKAKPRAHTKRINKLMVATLICMDLPNFENTLYDNPGQQILTGVTEYLRTVNTVLDLHYVQSSNDQLSRSSYQEIADARKRSWKGVLLIYPFPRSVVDELMASYPVVSLVEQYGTAPLNCVDVDHHRGISRLIDELHDAGHRRIGFFTWRYSVQASWALRRYGAYLEKLTSLGLRPNLDDVVIAEDVGDGFVDAAREKILRLIRDGVTAWICAADHQAYDLIAWLQRQGVAVPRDVSVTGFDGIACPAGSPVLSTVEIPYRQIGVIGAKRLNDMVHMRFEPPQHILLDCELRQGKTIGSPPKTAPSAYSKKKASTRRK
jgi:LacI family transcriptional regulator